MHASSELKLGSNTRGRRAFWPLVVVLALLGLTARLWNVDFDQRQHLHPDERFWSITADGLRNAPQPAAHGTAIGPLLDWLDGQRSPGNPYRATESFLYGPLPLVLARSTSAWLLDGVQHGDQPASTVAHVMDALGVPLIDSSGAARFDDAYGVDLVGRMLGAVFDTMTIIVVALIGRRVGGALAGVAAAALYASCVLAIQYSHFLGAEPLLGLASALTVFAALRLDRGAEPGRAASTGVVAGLAAGLTVAVKLTGVGLVVVPFVGCVALLVRHRRRSDLVRLVAFAIGAAAAFRFADPSAFNGLGVSLSQSFRDDLQRASDLVHSTAPPSFQWADRTPLLQPLVWLGVFTVGPGIALAFLFGAGVIGARLVDRRARVSDAPGGAPTWMDRLWRSRRGPALITDVGIWPLTIVLAAAVVPFTYVVATSLPSGRYFMPMLPGLVAVAGVGLAALVRWTRQARGLDRIATTGVAAVSLTLAVVWGVSFVAGVYGHTNTRIEASRWIQQHVPPGSVLSSQAWDDGLPLRLPDLDTSAYPSEQFNMVGPDDEVKVATIAAQLARIDYVVESSPRIWGTVTRMPVRFPSTINFFRGLDSGALGFERVATFRSGLTLGPWRLDDSQAEEAFSVYDHPEVRIWRKVRPVTRDQIVAVLDPVAASNAVPVEFEAAAANGLMLHPDEVAANAAGPTYDEAFDTDGNDVLQAVAWFVLLELLGLAAFALFLPVLHRLPDAGLGVAKVLGLGSLAFGLFVMAAWLHLALDRGPIAVLVIAFLLGGAWTGWRRRGRLRELWHERRAVLVTAEIVTAAFFLVFVIMRAANPDLWHPDRGGEKPFEMALLTAVLRTRTLPVYDPWFSGGALNYYYGGWLLLAAPARLLRTSPALVMNLAMGVFAACASGAAYSATAAVIGGVRKRWNLRPQLQRACLAAGVLGALLVLTSSNAAIVRDTWQLLHGRVSHAGETDWWSLSRVIPGSVAITEFPAWSLLFGDVHPHAMGIAVLLATGVLVLVWHRAIVGGERAIALAASVMLGVALGLVRMTNTWDFPLAVGLAVAALGLVVLTTRRWRDCVVPGLVLAVMVVVVWSPYTRRGQVFDAGFDAASLHTPLLRWFEQFAPFVVISVVLVVRHLADAFESSRRIRGWVSEAHLAVAGVSCIAIGYLALRREFPVFELTTLLAVACVWIALRSWRLDQRRARPMTGPAADVVARMGRAATPVGAAALAVGWAIQAWVEMFTLRNDGGRQNTVFKLWYESWVVLAVGAAAVVVGLLGERVTWSRRAARVALAGVLVLSAAFWVRATPVRLEDRVSAGGLSLDGQAYLTPKLVIGADDVRFVPADDLPLVDFLRRNVRGIQVVSEAPGDDYRWTGRISWMTGLPTPIGWKYHETQQRRAYSGIISSRADDMTRLYTTTDPGEMARILSRYSVSYVVFGTQEQLLSTFPSAGALRRFSCLSVVATADRSTVDGTVPGDLFVAKVDRACVIRLRPPLAPPPTTS